MGRDKHTIGVPPFTRLLRIERVANGWRLWTGTRDYRAGNYLLLNDDGSAHNVTARANEGDEVFTIRPSDRELANE